MQYKHVGYFASNGKLKSHVQLHWHQESAMGNYHGSSELQSEIIVSANAKIQLKPQWKYIALVMVNILFLCSSIFLDS